jgi:methylenetetrahydrofolate reductase (NADPH)
MTPDRPISAFFAAGHPLKSIEFFPPKDDAGVEQLRLTAQEIRKLSPDYVSITYGAGGSTRERTAQIARQLREEHGFVTMAHLTCVNHSPTEIEQIAAAHHASGIRNLMALRGDVPKGSDSATAFKPGLRYGADLVALLKRTHPDFCLGVGGYPEKHPEAASATLDLDNLARKVDAGADFIVTQLFFDNAVYYRFVEACRARGIRVPIVPGIMPVLSLKQIRRITEMCGATLPAQLGRRLEAAGDSAEAVEFIGLEWAITQIRGLLANNAPGYHLYTLNRAKSALALVAALAA